LDRPGERLNVLRRLVWIKVAQLNLKPVPKPDAALLQAFLEASCKTGGDLLQARCSGGFIQLKRNRVLLAEKTQASRDKTDHQ
jgi:hypothetical protein